MRSRLVARYSSREVRIRVPTFSVVDFSRGTLPTKKGLRKGTRCGTWVGTRKSQSQAKDHVPKGNLPQGRTKRPIFSCHDKNGCVSKSGTGSPEVDEVLLGSL